MESHLPPPHYLPAKFADFLEHWQSLRVDGAVPRLAAFLDNVVPAFQPWVGIVDVNDRDFHEIRLMGTGLVACFGFDGTGKNFLTFPSPDADSRVRRRHSVVPATPCGSFYRSVCVTSTGREIEIIGMALPLVRSNGGPCVVWILELQAVLGFGETGTGIKQVFDERWIDIGSGVPE
ncbi:MAG: hypothetical protein EPO08_13130 [Rhodospirillaceae bacterium]|nr:MAG: hypothetical protein EPO08_13130 [Rhodospirillaceae bacterium]